ncbi:MAG: EamA family transporter [Actinobacteria bacterium]|nr:EamA family transporter [Actinomycetota bacterium]
MIKSLILILISISIAILGQFCLKAGMNQVGRISGADAARPTEIVAKVAGVPLVWVGLVLYGVSAVFWLVVLSRVDLSFAYPMLGFSYVIVLIVSKIFLHEEVVLTRWIGAVIISVGVALVALK